MSLFFEELPQGGFTQANWKRNLPQGTQYLRDFVNEIYEEESGVVGDLIYTTSTDTGYVLIEEDEDSVKKISEKIPVT